MLDHISTLIIGDYEEPPTPKGKARKPQAESTLDTHPVFRFALMFAHPTKRLHIYTAVEQPALWARLREADRISGHKLLTFGYTFLVDEQGQQDEETIATIIPKTDDLFDRITRQYGPQGQTAEAKEVWMNEDRWALRSMVKQMAGEQFHSIVDIVQTYRDGGHGTAISMAIHNLTQFASLIERIDRDGWIYDAEGHRHLLNPYLK